MQNKAPLLKLISRLAMIRKERRLPLEIIPLFQLLL
jgi:hypothetical protein